MKSLIKEDGDPWDLSCPSQTKDSPSGPKQKLSSFGMIDWMIIQLIETELRTNYGSDTH